TGSRHRIAGKTWRGEGQNPNDFNPSFLEVLTTQR
ncbi:PHP domain protein, partial [Vibrio parahaemolyticus 10296]